MTVRRAASYPSVHASKVIWNHPNGAGGVTARRAASPPVPSLWRAYRRWRVAAGPLADYVLPAPFLATWEPPTTPLRSEGAARIARDVARRAGPGIGRGTALILEATPRLGLAVGVRLHASGSAVAPLFGRWPVPRAVLPAERLTAWLTQAMADAPAIRSASDSRARSRAPGDAPRLLCLLLDAERGRRVSQRTLRHRFDNRYEYATFLLPPPARWQRWGVTRILWAGPAAVVPPDLTTYAESLVDSGIAVELIRLFERRASRRTILSPER
ncbi:MAG: hypothetical protein M3442_19735 [Chloroflexota bacterium]|nr:hypothetical protein [Chloroflexota bacterium]